MSLATAMSVRVGGRKIRLPLWDDSEYNAAEAKARSIGKSFDECPTCKGRRIETDDEAHHGWVNGQYRFRGEIHECDCQGQMALFRHYLWANIPMQYMRLNWEVDYDRDPQVKADVEKYINLWKNFRDQGMGVTLFGARLGVGKTFAATTIAKGVLRRGERVFFMSFKDLLSSYQLPADERGVLESRMKESTLLVLDEVLPPTSDAQKNFFADFFEALIRHRTNWDLPTVITTNLTEGLVLAHYPRVYSLLAPKQWTMHMTGGDERQSRIAIENIELAANGEVRPLV